MDNKDSIFPHPYHLLLGILGLYVFRFGYAYGFSDQDEFLPFLMHLIDPSLFTTDWFVDTQLSSFSIRTYFVYLILGPAKLLSPPVAIAFLYILCWLTTASGLYVLANHLSQNRLAAILSVAIILVFTPFWTLGGNDLVHSMLVPSMLGWSLGVWGMVFFLRHRFFIAAMLFGIATLFQALVGLQLGLVTGLVMIVMLFTRQLPSFSRLFFFGVIYLVFSSPALIPLVYQQLFAASATITGPLFPSGPSLFYIMAEFRNPHHYLFHSFDIQRMIQFGFLASLGLPSMYLIHRSDNTFPTFSVSSILGVIFSLCVLAYISTEVFHVLTIAKLQIFKLTVLAKILLIIVICKASVILLPSDFQARLEAFLFSYPGRFLATFTVAYFVLVAIQRPRFETKVFPFSATLDSKVAVYDWARANTPKAAIFATPPSWSGFRTSAQRSIVINHKAFPYDDASIHLWLRQNRLSHMTAFDPFKRTDKTLMVRLDSAYESLSNEQLEKNIEEYQINYLIRATQLDSTSHLLFSTGNWYVYGVDKEHTFRP